MQASIMERPHFSESNDRIRELVDEHWDDLWELGQLAYEVQFRERIGEELCGEIVERVVELAVQKGRPEPPEPGFEFPSTDVSETRRSHVRELGRVDWRETGLLRLSGYRVGETHGVAEPERRRLLNYILLRDDLNDVEDRAYAREWGAPRTPKRLQKLANTIAALVRNAKRNPAFMRRAIEDWESDLEYLKETFFERWGEFPWPGVEV